MLGSRTLKAISARTGAHLTRKVSFVYSEVETEESGEEDGKTKSLSAIYQTRISL